jgi:hypothetical protein
MKKLLTWASPALFASLILAGCQKSIEGGNELTPDRAGIDAKAAACCVTSYSATNAVVVYENAARGVVVTAWNDATNTHFTITRTGGNMTVRFKSPGEALTQTTGPTILDGGTTVTTSVANPAGWTCGDPITISYYVSGLGGGSGTAFQTGIITHNLQEVCGCDDEFDAALTCGEVNTLVVSFKAAEAGDYVIQGGLTAGATILSATANGLTLNPTHPSAGGPSSVTRWEGAIGECGEVTVTITFTGGNGVGSWSAKLGEETKGYSESQSCN